MKTKSIYVAAVALTMMATGCSDDQLVQVQEPAEQGRQVRVSASMGTDSRLAITDTGKRLEYAWEATDAFYVFDPANNQTTTFVMDTEEFAENSPMGTFVGTPNVAYTTGNKLYAVYNKQQDALTFDENGNVTLDISQQSGKLDDKYQFLFAETTYDGQGKTSFQFRHLVTMMKVNITVPEGVTSLKEINFGCNGMPTRATLVLDKAPNDSYNQFVPGDLVSCYDYNNTYTNKLTLTGEFVPVDGVVTVYVYAFPVKQYYGNNNWYNEPYLEPSVWMSDDKGVDYVGTATFRNKEIEAGKTYQLNTEVVSLTPFANEETATGKGPYEIATADQLYTFMLRTSKAMYNSDGYCYTNCHYVLTDDIVLNNEMPWEPTDYYESTFDGQGHTISGNLTMEVLNQTGLFRFMNECTVQNLTLDLNVQFTNENGYWEDYFGLLASEIYNTKIVNCVNHSDVSGKFYHMGGLIGKMRWNSSVIASGNTGNVSATGHCLQIGGIVAQMESNYASLEGCYNTGLLAVNTVNQEGLKAGGIAGNMDSWDGAILNCWSNSTLTIENVVYDDTEVEDLNNIYFGGIVGYQYRDAITNCYWNEAVEYASGYQGEEAEEIGGGTFADKIPTAAQFAVMNASIMSKGWQYNESDGTLKPVTGIVAPSIPKEEW